MHIRPAVQDDAAIITQIYVRAWNNGFGSRMPQIEASPARIERWQHDLSNATPTRWWVAEVQGEAVGFVGLGPSRDPVDPALGELDTIAVSPNTWRTGVGKALMRVALDRLRSDGYRSALLWTLSRYPQGESFYRANGWRLNGATRDGGNQVRYDYDLT